MGDPRVYADLLATQSNQMALIDGLVRERFSIIPAYFSPELITDLHRELHYHRRRDHLHAAHIGKDSQRVRVRDIRGDSILWLDGSSAAQRAFLDEMEQLRRLINRELFLSLIELETHFAYYPPDTGYRRHVDSFHNDNLRRISFAAYLNPAWRGGDGGELLVYRGDEVVAEIPPVAGTLACFVSEEVPHEVAVTRAGRASIAGWFRVREIGALPIQCGDDQHS